MGQLACSRCRSECSRLPDLGLVTLVPSAHRRAGGRTLPNVFTTTPAILVRLGAEMQIREETTARFFRRNGTLLPGAARWGHFLRLHRCIASRRLASSAGLRPGNVHVLVFDLEVLQPILGAPAGAQPFRLAHMGLVVPKPHAIGIAF